MINWLAQSSPIVPQDPQTQSLKLPEVEYWVLTPELMLIGAALAILLVTSLFKVRFNEGSYSFWMMGAGGAGLISAVYLWARIEGGEQLVTALANSFVVDGFSVFLVAVISIAVILGGLVSASYLEREQLHGPEYPVLLLFSAVGGMLMVSANDLIVLFLGLEILSISLYVMAGFNSRRNESTEAAMKYFILGAFSSALFLYGIALVYGAVGSTNLSEISAFLSTNTLFSDGVLLAGVFLLLVGLGFKVAAVPFHAWTPDVYQGAPTPVTGFMAATAKVAGFGALLRIFFSTFQTLKLDWQPIIWVIAVLTLLVGSIVAIVQNDVKRMLAYSSISHAGYILLGLHPASKAGIAASLFYLLTYTFIIIGSFAIITAIGEKGDAKHSLDNYKGLSKREPLLAFLFTVLLLAQVGIPLTSGFFAKFYVVSAIVTAGSYALAVIAMLVTVIAAFFYLRILVLMYMTEGEDQPAVALPAPVAFTAIIAVAVTILLGFFPTPAIEFARDAAAIL